MNRESPQSTALESQEKPKKYLFIDDGSDLIELFKVVFGKDENMSAIECHSVPDARAAIESIMPDIIFLDNSLSAAGGEGLLIASEVKQKYPDMKIYSTTSDIDAIQRYEDMGIEHVDKHDISKMMSIVSDK